MEGGIEGKREGWVDGGGGKERERIFICMCIFIIVLLHYDLKWLKILLPRCID